LKRLAVIEADVAHRDEYLAAYERWKTVLAKSI
jgi:hypothetical protein